MIMRWYEGRKFFQINREEVRIKSDEFGQIRVPEKFDELVRSYGFLPIDKKDELVISPSPEPEIDYGVEIKIAKEKKEKTEEEETPLPKKE